MFHVCLLPTGWKKEFLPNNVSNIPARPITPGFLLPNHRSLQHRAVKAPSVATTEATLNPTTVLHMRARAHAHMRAAPRHPTTRCATLRHATTCHATSACTFCIYKVLAESSLVSGPKDLPKIDRQLDGIASFPCADGYVLAGMHVCTYVCVSMHVCMYACMRASLCACVCTCVSQVCVHAYVCACKRVYYSFDFHVGSVPLSIAPTMAASPIKMNVRARTPMHSYTCTHARTYVRSSWSGQEESVNAYVLQLRHP